MPAGGTDPKDLSEPRCAEKSRGAKAGQERVSARSGRVVLFSSGPAGPGGHHLRTPRGHRLRQETTLYRRVPPRPALSSYSNLGRESAWEPLGGACAALCRPSQPLHSKSKPGGRRKQASHAHPNRQALRTLNGRKRPTEWIWGAHPGLFTTAKRKGAQQADQQKQPSLAWI